jgi:tetratricopeptide (TPR) repeat protein
MKILLSCAFVLFLFGSPLLAMSSPAAPPDTVTNIVDKSSALLLIDQGKQLINEGKVRDALIVFKEAAIKDPMTWKAPYWISYCHFKLNNFGYARQYGEEAIAKGNEDVDKDIYEILGSSYHRTGSLDTARMYYEKAINELPKGRVKELRIEKKLAECEYAHDAMAKNSSLRVAMRGEVNSGFNEYSPILTEDGQRMYFTSRRGNTTGGRVNPDDQEYFEDIYSAKWNATNQQWDSVTNSLERLNTEGFDALSYISKDGLYALIVHNNTATDAKKQTGSSDICEAEFTKKGKWAPPRVIANKTINTTFMEGAATLTADGNTMYFVSDRKGDKRSTDIYMVQRQGKKWGVAQALPDSINTVGRETTPYVTPDGRYLFFSSDGHTGMGGLDVYVCENTGRGWSSPMNLGAAVNSVNDDTHFRIYRDLGKVVMSGFNIQGQKSSMDLYEIELSRLTLPVKL